MKSQVYERSIGICQKNCGKLHTEELTQTGKHMFSVAELPQYSKSEWCYYNDVFHLLKFLVKEINAELPELQELEVVERVIANIDIINIGKSNLKNEIILLDINTTKKTYNNLIWIETNDKKVNY